MTINFTARVEMENLDFRIYRRKFLGIGELGRENFVDFQYAPKVYGIHHDIKLLSALPEINQTPRLSSSVRKEMIIGTRIYFLTF